MSTTKQKKAEKKRDADVLSTADKNDLPKKTFAFPKQRKEPLNDAKHVRNAVARFNQVEGVTDAERNQAWKRIRRAAARYDIDLEVTSWRDLGSDKAKPKKTKKKGKKGKKGTKKGKKS